MSNHQGHRQRIKNRFRQNGLDEFEEVYALELLLFYAVGRQDTRPLAERLLEHFGSFTGVLNASAEQLEEVEGVGEHISTYLTLLTQTVRYYEVHSMNKGRVFRSIEECGEFLVKKFLGKNNETVIMLCLDAKCKLLACRIVGEGSVNSANVPIRRMVEMALGAHATTVVLAHNHPSGLAIPSAEDVETTARVAAALDTVDIVLADHIVVADNDYVSMVQSRYYTPNPGQTVK